MPELQFLKTLVFHRALEKLQLQNLVNFSIFSYLTFMSVSIIKEMTFVASVKSN